MLRLAVVVSALLIASGAAQQRGDPVLFTGRSVNRDANTLVQRLSTAYMLSPERVVVPQLTAGGNFSLYFTDASLGALEYTRDALEYYFAFLAPADRLAFIGVSSVELNVSVSTWSPPPVISLPAVPNRAVVMPMGFATFESLDNISRAAAQCLAVPIGRVVATQVASDGTSFTITFPVNASTVNGSISAPLSSGDLSRFCAAFAPAVGQCVQTFSDTDTSVYASGVGPRLVRVLLDPQESAVLRDAIHASGPRGVNAYLTTVLANAAASEALAGSLTIAAIEAPANGFDAVTAFSVVFRAETSNGTAVLATAIAMADNPISAAVTSWPLLFRGTAFAEVAATAGATSALVDNVATLYAIPPSRVCLASMDPVQNGTCRFSFYFTEGADEPPPHFSRLALEYYLIHLAPTDRLYFTGINALAWNTTEVVPPPDAVQLKSVAITPVTLQVPLGAVDVTSRVASCLAIPESNVYVQPTWSPTLVDVTFASTSLADDVRSVATPLTDADLFLFATASHEALQQCVARQPTTAPSPRLVRVELQPEELLTDVNTVITSILLAAGPNVTVACLELSPSAAAIVTFRAVVANGTWAVRRAVETALRRTSNPSAPPSTRSVVTGAAVAVGVAVVIALVGAVSLRALRQRRRTPKRSSDVKRETFEDGEAAVMFEARFDV